MLRERHSPPVRLAGPPPAPRWSSARGRPDGHLRDLTVAGARLRPITPKEVFSWPLPRPPRRPAPRPLPTSPSTPSCAATSGVRSTTFVSTPEGRALPAEGRAHRGAAQAPAGQRARRGHRARAAGRAGQVGALRAAVGGRQLRVPGGEAAAHRGAGGRGGAHPRVAGVGRDHRAGPDGGREAPPRGRAEPDRAGVRCWSSRPRSATRSCRSASSRSRTSSPRPASRPTSCTRPPPGPRTGCVRSPRPPPRRRSCGPRPTSSASATRPRRRSPGWTRSRPTCGRSWAGSTTCCRTSSPRAPGGSGPAQRPASSPTRPTGVDGAPQAAARQAGPRGAGGEQRTSGAHLNARTRGRNGWSARTSRVARRVPGRSASPGDLSAG